MPGNFSNFEREAAKLLAELRGAVDRVKQFEADTKAGRTTGSEVAARSAETYSPGAGPSGGDGATEQAIRERGLATDQLTSRQRALTAAETESSNAERVMAQVMSQNSAQMRTSGALTNEFVDSAKRGEVTVKQLGQEVTGTIAKFGGWITAGSAVYFAFDALTAVKKGAIDASSGVNELERVVNHVSQGKAEESFRSLAQEFNVPIETAADAAYEMGKVFGSQNDAFTAAKQVLYAVKIGELDTATASKYLISIINGFHLPASRMAQVFDQVNEAQNNFGISTESVLSGVAKAAGTFHQASGEFKKYGQDYSYLLALITTGSKVTGQTGVSIGTAISRSPGFIRRPSNQETLRQFGIDPNGAIEEVYNEAFKKAQSLSGKQVQILASAIGGPQLGARVFTGLLSNYKEFQKVLHETSPENSKGSAHREFEKQVHGVDEQINRIGTSLETIGAELAKSHFFDSLGLGLKTLNGMLTLVNSLATDFGKLPGPVQQTLAYLIQASVVLKAMRRLNLGETIVGGEGREPGAVRGGAARFFGYESKDAQARQVRKAFFAEQDALEKERGRLGGQLYRGQRQETLAYGAAGTANQELSKTVEQYGALSPEAAAAQQKALGAEKIAYQATQDNLKLTIDEAAATDRLAAVQSSIAATRKRIIGGLDAEATLTEADKLGYPVQRSFGGKGLAPPGPLGTRATGLEDDATRTAEETTTKSTRLGGLLRTTETQAEAAGVMTTTTTRGLGGLNVSMGRLGSGLGKMGSAFSTLLGRAGELAFAAIAVGLLSDALNNENDKVTAEIEAISRIAGSPKARDHKLKELEAGSSDGENFQQRLSNVITEGVNVGGVHVPTFGIGKTFGLNTGKNINEEEAEIEKAEAKTIREERQLQRKDGREGKAVPFRYIGGIVKDIERVKDSNRSSKEINEALDKYENELERSHDSPNHDAELKKARALITQGKIANTSSSDLVEKLQVLEIKEIDQRLQAVVGNLGGGNGVAFNSQAAKKASLIYQAEVQKVGSATDAGSLQSLTQAREEYFGAIQTAIQNELQYQLDITKSPSGKNQAYTSAYNRLRQFANSENAAVKKQEQVVKQLRSQKSKQEDQHPLEATGWGDLSYGSNTKAVEAIDKEIGVETQKLKGLKEGEGQKARFIRDIVVKLREQQYETNEALRSAREAARESLTANPIAQAQEKIDFLNDEITRAIAVYGSDSTQVLQLITEKRQEQQQVVQDQLGSIQARGNLTTAGIVQNIPKEKAALYGAGGLLAQLRFVEEHRSDFDPKQVIELQAQVESAKTQLTHDVELEAKAVADAKFGIREAKAEFNGNTAQSAKVALAKAKYDLEHAETPAEKFSAQQQYINAAAAKREAVASARLESINYEASIQKLTTSQEIEQLENLLQTYKVGLAARRQIREQIHSLKGQLAGEGQGFNLNVGDFSLPTAYDIRRAVLGASGNHQTSISQVNNFHIENHSSDPNVVGRAIEGVLGSAADSAARSAGVG